MDKPKYNNTTPYKRVENIKGLPNGYVNNDGDWVAWWGRPCIKTRFADLKRRTNEADDRVAYFVPARGISKVTY